MATSAELTEAPSVERAAPGEKAIIANLMQFYSYDFAPYALGHAEGALGADGRYRDDRFLASYWEEEGRIPHLVRVGHEIAGFALINRHFWFEPPADWSMAEFFVHRRFRGLGVGRMAAHRLFAEHPGIWELAILRANAPAQDFWRRVIEVYPGVRGRTVRDGAERGWDGFVYRFDVG